MLTWFVAVSAALCLLAGASKLLFLSIKQRMELDLKLRLYRRFLSQPISFFDKASTGDLMARLSDDSQNMLYPVRYTLSSIVQTVLG
jgi:ABC-type multidrug transport system fused ATPase/permease subunit